jgi:hypothetical protein
MEVGEIDNLNEVSDSDVVDSINEQDKVDISSLNIKNNKTFAQCSSAGDIYSEEELNE